VLRLVASPETVDLSVCQSAAVHFKNIVKKGWAVNEDGSTTIFISPEDRNLIKSNLVELMCKVPPQIKAQCTETISLIAANDFPNNWLTLLPEIVQKFNSPDPAIVNGVLQTANSILKRFRYEQRTDALYADIIYTLNILQAPLLSLFKTTGQAIQSFPDNVSQLRPRFETLQLICRIFYSLNIQDLPEYFEDHMAEWMKEFSKYLTYENIQLIDANEETEPSVIDSLQDAIVKNLHLYADKDEETFMPFLPDFTSLIWKLLMSLSSFEKQDILATTCIKFLSLLIGKLMHKNIFQGEETLNQIVSKIVIPNLMIREVDKERFEDDAQEFILGDMEGGDTASRRRCSQDLLRSMCRQFESEATQIALAHVNTMLAEFATSPTEKWTQKDAAIHLIMGISIRSESLKGVSALNEKVNLMDFFSSHIVTELKEVNQSIRPMVTATAIKFVGTFRNQFTKDNMVTLMPLLIMHLSSPSIVVHSYAASAIEKFQTCKVVDINGKENIKFGGTEIEPFLEPLFSGLFTIVENNVWNENEYVMKCVMRSLNTGKNSIIQVVEIVLGKLTTSLEVVAKNPRNPSYNHYMFESISVLLKSVCATNPEHTPSFEKLLFPPFQSILQQDVSEFTPYVFQILAQLLEYRSNNSGLGQSFTVLFPPLLSPVLWDRKGNIPALTRLLQAYLSKGAIEIVAKGQFLGMLGVFQKLVASRSNEVQAFELLGTILHFVPFEALQPHLKQLIQLLLTRLQKGKTERYVRLVTTFFAQYIGQFGPQKYFEVFDSVQAGIGLMILTSIWLPRLQSDIPVHMEAKIQVVGLTKILCETPALLTNDVNGICFQVLCNLVRIMTSTDTAFNNVPDKDDTDIEVGYDPTFSRLHFASKPQLDPFSQIQDPSLAFAQGLLTVYRQFPDQIRTLVQKMKDDQNPKLSAGLASIFQKTGITLA